MSVSLSSVFGAAGQVFDDNGNPLSGGKIFTYLAGTTTNQATYTTSAGNVAHTNPIILDAAGRVPTGEIWLTDGILYKFSITTSADVLIGTYDNLSGIDASPNASNVTYTPAATSLFGTSPITVKTALDGLSHQETGSTKVGFLQSGTGAVAQTVQNKLRQYINILDFGADRSGNSGFDNTPALNNAIAAAVASDNKTIYIPAGSYYFNTKPNDITSAIKIVGDGKSNTVLRRNFNGVLLNDGLINIRDGCFGCVFENFSIADEPGLTQGCQISMWKYVADGTPAGDFTIIQNCNFSTFGTDTRYAAIVMDGELRTSPTGIRNVVISGCSVFGGTTASIYARVVRGLDIVATNCFQSGGTTGKIIITGTAGKNSISININGFGIDGLNLTHTNGVTVSCSNMGLIENDATAGNLTFIGLSSSGIQPNIPSSHYINSAVRAEFSDLLVKNKGGGTAPSGTTNQWGLYVTPFTAGEILIDALNSGANTGFMRFRTYDATTYRDTISILASGEVRFPSIGTTASAANAVIGNFNALLISTSSSRYKTQIENIENFYVNNIYKFRPIWYRSTVDADNKDWSWYGLIAEEVAEIEPRLVHWRFDKYDTDETGKKTPSKDAKLIPDGVQYERLSVLLLKAIQQQNERIEQLEATVKKLEGNKNENS